MGGRGCEVYARWLLARQLLPTSLSANGAMLAATSGRYETSA